MKIIKTILITIVVLALAALGLVYGIKFKRDYDFKKEQREKQEEKVEALSKINYTIPEEFKVPVSGDRGEGYIDYNYDENDMTAQIKLDAWKEDRYVWKLADRISTVVETGNNSNKAQTFSKVIQGPEEVDLNGIKAQLIVAEGYNDDGGAYYDTATFSFRDYTYLFLKDGFIYEISYRIVDENYEKYGTPDDIMKNRKDAKTNKCITLREKFIGSISPK